MGRHRACARLPVGSDPPNSRCCRCTLARTCSRPRKKQRPSISPGVGSDELGVECVVTRDPPHSRYVLERGCAACWWAKPRDVRACASQPCETCVWCWSSHSVLCCSDLCVPKSSLLLRTGPICGSEVQAGMTVHTANGAEERGAHSGPRIRDYPRASSFERRGGETAVMTSLTRIHVLCTGVCEVSPPPSPGDSKGSLVHARFQRQTIQSSQAVLQLANVEESGQGLRRQVAMTL